MFSKLFTTEDIIDLQFTIDDITDVWRNVDGDDFDPKANKDFIYNDSR